MSELRDRIKKFARVPVSKLRANPRNWRTHPESQRKALRGVLDEIGFSSAVIARELPDGTYELIDGHLRLETLADTDKIPTLILDVDEHEADKLLLTLDPLAAMAGTDKEMLAGLFESTSFDDDALASLIADTTGYEFHLEDDDQDGEDAEPQIDKAEELRAKWGVERGQLWRLGEHRIICEDSEFNDAYKRLLVDEMASLVFADPPYGVSYQSNMRVASKQFDVLPSDDVFLELWIARCSAWSEGFVFIWTAWKVFTQWKEIAERNLGEITNVIIWDKGGGGIGDLKHTFFTDFEMAIVVNRGAELTGKRIGSVWGVSKDAAASYMHTTQKPVLLAENAIESCTCKGDIVLDPFSGSGTTLIACENLGRKCRAIEISPAYVAVAIQRWADHTGRTPELVR